MKILASGKQQTSLVGIHLDRRLNYKVHCSELAKKLRYCLHGLAKI